MAIVPNGAIEVVKKNTNPLADVAAKIQSINNNPVQGPLTYPQFNNSGQTMSWNNTINTQTGVPQNLNLNTTTNTVQPVSPTPASVNNNTNTNTQTNTNAGATTTKTPSESDKVISEIRDYLNQKSTIPDATGEIEKQKQADLEALRANIAAKVSTINTDIAGAQGKFQPLRENVDVQRAQNLQRVKEMMASQGVFGGDNLTANIGVNTQASNNISQIDQQQEAYKKSLEDQIRQLQLAQTSQEANIISQSAAAAREAMYKNAELAQNEKNAKVSSLLSLLGTTSQKEQNDFTNSLDTRKQDFTENTTNKQIANDEYWKQKTYDSTEAQRIWENNYKDNTFNYQKERDKVGDSQWGQQYQLQIDKFAWDKNPDNPAVKSQIIDNQLKDLELSIQKDPNSPENQMKKVQLETAKDQLAKLKAVTPDMTVKQFNAGLDKIYADISQGWKSLDIQQQNANTSAYRASNSGSSGSGSQNYVTFNDAQGLAKKYATDLAANGTDTKGVGYISDVANHIDNSYSNLTEAQRSQLKQSLLGANPNHINSVQSYANFDADLSRMSKSDAQNYLKNNSATVKSYLGGNSTDGNYYYNALVNKYK